MKSWQTSSTRKGISPALLLISLILIYYIGHYKNGLLSLIPNLFAAMLAFGLWGYLQSEVRLVVAVVAAISLGIVVDDMVHFLSRYLRAREEYNFTAEQAVRYSFSTVGSAIVVTLIAPSAGFLILTLSGFHPDFSIRILTVI